MNCRSASADFLKIMENSAQTDSGVIVQTASD